ncbi:phosphatidylinositol-specific phospholipase c [Grosmannia clavigera kw1407]|uniref:Phosphatidylinositol-specific phospholipase c n=1 Tax=Grosmannia clavigera (strain kw1407 / UAMH 11150) TaxID=655863 RepID=F0X8J4_GROCL|nr:phosphatidylinositol-specific phospholipase c [Grosmannia clavigera kw1407]EFX05335.1 phosphatidylinositol-specific phospholipase c [Grosmannia clavigera kw1407]
MASSSCQHRYVAHRSCGRCLLISIPPLFVIFAFSLLFLGSRLWGEWPAYANFHLLSLPPFNSSSSYLSETTSKTHSSPYSFDIEASSHPDWMSGAPDDWSLALLSLPGTHDTLTHRVHSEWYQCQNSALATQLRAGVRYLDVRARVQIPPSPSKRGEGEPWPLGIYHGDAYTGYGFAEVVSTVFAFLDANPSEIVVLRLKEEAKPIVGSVGDPPGVRPTTSSTSGNSSTSSPDWWQQFNNSAQTQPSLFEASFNRYRLNDSRTASGFSDHLYRFPSDDGTGSLPPTRIPTVGELRGKVLLLQEFPNFKAASHVPTYFGIPWQLSSALLQVEDLWQIADMAHLEKKWSAIRENLQAAGKAADDDSKSMPLFLSHLSASVGVTPINAAAGHGSVVGMNDRTGQWVAASHDKVDEASKDDKQHQPPVGIVIADFPGHRLVEAVLQRNNFTRELF